MPAPRPNFVFILADDLGWGDLSCFGRPDYKTPGIDALAASGMKLTQGYANSATCSPTRTGLITGRYQYRLPVGLYDPLPSNLNVGLPPTHPTLPRQLAEAGYTTALIGKWHLGALPDYGPLKSGYDEFFGVMDGEIDYFSHRSGGLLDASKAFDCLYEGESLIERDGYMTELLTDRAVAYLEREHTRPFLLSLHYTAPHWPWEGPKDRDVSRGLDHHLHFDGGSMQTFAEMVKCLDDGVARVCDTLRARGLDRDTLIVFSSDNGGERWSFNWPFRGEKTDLWEGGIRVPTIAAWPGRIQPGSVSDQVVMSMDWMPTFLALAGGKADPDHPLDGIDVSGPLLGSMGPISRKVFWRTYNMGAARDGAWKYVVGTEQGYEYLFNIERDERENANLKKREPKIFQELRQSYQEWNAQMLPIPPEARRTSLRDAGRALALTRNRS